MPGNNAKSFYDLFVSRAFPANMGAASVPNITDTEIFGYLNRGLARVQKFLRMVQVRDSDLTLRADQQTYTLPALHLGTSIRQIAIKNQSGMGHIVLSQRSNQFMRDNFNLDDTSQDSGDPAFWCYSNEVTGSTTAGLLFNKKFIIRPVPKWTWANGIIIDYPPVNRALQRIFNVDVATSSAAFVFGSEIVTVTGTANFLIGDEIGRVFNTQTDGVSTAGLGKETVRRWYTIINISQTAVGPPAVYSVTLAEPYADFSASTQPFIAAEVSPTEMALPDEAAVAPVYLALEEYLLSKEPQRASTFGEYGRKLLSECYQEFVGQSLKFPRFNDFPWLWRNGGRGWPYGLGQNLIWP